MVMGSILVSFLPRPKNRVRVIYLTMLFAMGTENFILAFSREPVVWCIGQIVGWFLVPVMSTNLEVLLRTGIPVELQGRVYACRNTLQFFTIPIGLFFGRGHGRSRFGAIYGGADGKCVPDSVIWSRKRLRRGADDVCICRFGKFFLCHCREISSEICKGRNELKKE